MIRTLALRNRQRVRAVDTALLRRLTLHLLAEHFEDPSFEVGLHLVGAAEMARLNYQFLQHDGSTDVITFDHAESRKGGPLHGEIFMCLDDAVAQAREFGTTWQSELVRYVIHGLLHLHGHDDCRPAPRRLMKREENRLLREVAARFPISTLGKRPARRGPRQPVS